MTTKILVGHVLDKRGLDGRFLPGVHAYREPKPHWDRDWLHQQYIANGRSCSDIAREVGCKENNIHFWLKKHGIKARSISEARKLKQWGASGADNPMYGRCGPNNPAYRGGTTPERQSEYAKAEWRSFVALIFKRDGYCCVRCSSPKRRRKGLHAHHIASYAEYPDLRRDPLNVVTLCDLCHRWVHSNKNTERKYLK